MFVFVWGGCASLSVCVRACACVIPYAHASSQDFHFTPLSLRFLAGVEMADADARGRPLLFVFVWGAGVRCLRVCVCVRARV